MLPRRLPFSSFEKVLSKNYLRGIPPGDSITGLGLILISASALRIVVGDAVALISYSDYECWDGATCEDSRFAAELVDMLILALSLSRLFLISSCCSSFISS